MNPYVSTPEGVDALRALIASLQQQINEMKGANGLESAVIVGRDGITATDPATKKTARLADGALYLNDGTGGRSARIYKPSLVDGTPSDRAVVIDPSGDYDPLSATRQTFFMLSSDEQDGNLPFADLFVGGPDGVGGAIVLNTPTDGVSLIQLASPKVQLVGIPTTSNSANLHHGVIGSGGPTIAFVTSSERYKTDIADADIDPEAVLRWRPRTWRDKTDVAAVGDAATEHIGFIAEEIHEQTPDFVVLDGEGRPDSLKYDRMVAGLHAVVQQQAEHLATQAKQIATLTARLDALEAT